MATDVGPDESRLRDGDRGNHLHGRRHQSGHGGSRGAERLERRVRLRNIDFQRGFFVPTLKRLLHDQSQRQPRILANEIVEPLRVVGGDVLDQSRLNGARRGVSYFIV